MQLQPKDKKLINDRVREYNESKSKEHFKDQLLKWKENRQKFLNDYFPDRKDDKIMMCIKQILLRISVMVLVLFSCNISAQRVTKVIDGDTFIVDYSRVIRVADIDCPELNQNYGRMTKNVVEGWILGKKIKLNIKGKDKYGRYIASVKFGRKDLAKQLLFSGLAWHYKKYSDDEELARLERYAKENRKGLWNQKHPTPPWDYRNF